MKTSSIRIYDVKPSKKNPNAKYVVKYIAKNGEHLASSESLNDVRAVKTHIAAMGKCVVDYAIGTPPFRESHDHTKEQKFAKSGYAIANP